MRHNDHARLAATGVHVPRTGVLLTDTMLTRPRLAMDAVARELGLPRAANDAVPGLVTTPNAEYNALFPNLPAGVMRHPDHRFEWTRAEFEVWAATIGSTYGYRPTFSGIGHRDDRLGTPTQMVVFTR